LREMRRVTPLVIVTRAHQSELAAPHGRDGSSIGYRRANRGPSPHAHATTMERARPTRTSRRRGARWSSGTRPQAGRA
jgi:hypothetical protein